MNVLYTCDNNYVWLMGISVISLFENNTSLEKLDVYLLGENISETNKKHLSDIAEKYGRDITVVDVPKLDIPESLVSSRWPLSAFTRLFCAQLLPEELEAVLYLDCDTIICSSIKDLNHTDVSGKTFWGVKDCIGKHYKKNIGLAGEDPYINAGVLYINLVRLRELSLNNRLNSYIEKYKKMINYADQDVLNGSFADEIGIIPQQFDLMTINAVYSYKEIKKLRRPTNYYSKNEFEVSKNNPVIIHYTTNMRIVRPWFSNTNHPYADLFRQYMKKSPWKNKELTEMTFTNKESKIIGFLEKFPKGMSLSILGFLHSTVKPLYVRIKAR